MQYTVSESAHRTHERESNCWLMISSPYSLFRYRSLKLLPFFVARKIIRLSVGTARLPWRERERKARYTTVRGPALPVAVPKRNCLDFITRRVEMGVRDVANAGSK